MNLQTGLKKLALFIGVIMITLIISKSVLAQTTIFTETLGTPTGTTAIATYTGYSNPTYTFTGTGDIRNTAQSTGYAGASGGGNVFFTAAGRTFQIAGINTTGYSSLTLSFGLYKPAIAADGSDFTIEVSNDGVTYKALTFPALPTGAGTAGWNLRTATGTIPATANLRIRFTNNTTTATQYRLDDITLAGIAPTAAGTIVGGRVIQQNGNGIRSAYVTMLDSMGVERTATTDAQGNYQFENVPSGLVYVFSVSHLRYQFEQPTQVQFIGEDVSGINFVGTSFTRFGDLFTVRNTLSKAPE